MPILFALVGATGIGKSALSMTLAEHYNAQIIGADSRQIYRGFSIGTAQPDSLCLKRVKHHLVNFLEPTESFSAGAFCSKVKMLLEENSQTNFILVGGTGLYLQSLFLGLPKIPAIPLDVRLNLEKIANELGPETLYKMACEVDLEVAKNIERNNIQRLIRVLEVFKATGQKLSEFQKMRKGGIGYVPTFWLQCTRETLYSRINSRVDKMLQDGFVDEVRELSKSVPITAPAWQSLGYRELLQANTQTQILQVANTIKQKTRNYAKRQLTWFRTQMQTIPIDINYEPFMQINKIFEQSSKNKT